MKVATFASDMEDLKKRVYSVIFAFAFLSGLFGAILALFNNTLNATLIFILAVNTVFHPVAIYLTWRKDVPLRLVDVLTVVYGASIFSGTMMASLYLKEAGQAISIEALYLWVSVIYIFSFASFKHKTALRFSIAIWILLFAISLPFITQSFSYDFIICLVIL